LINSFQNKIHYLGHYQCLIASSDPVMDHSGINSPKSDIKGPLCGLHTAYKIDCSNEDFGVEKYQLLFFVSIFNDFYLLIFINFKDCNIYLFYCKLNTQHLLHIGTMFLTIHYCIDVHYKNNFSEFILLSSYPWTLFLYDL
jgi:hypothetical protein